MQVNYVIKVPRGYNTVSIMKKREITTYKGLYLYREGGVSSGQLVNPTRMKTKKHLLRRHL